MNFYLLSHPPPFVARILELLGLHIFLPLVDSDIDRHWFPRLWTSICWPDFLSTKGPGAMIINADPEQMYLPKIVSKVNVDGTMYSNPLHMMEPQLSEDIASIVFRYLVN